MKIMRRAGLGKDGQITGSDSNTAEGSTAPSKAGSETGYDSQQGTGVVSPTDSNMAKDKSAMTREEREAKYKETRERIFGPESENADSLEPVNELSRTRSTRTTTMGLQLDRNTMLTTPRCSILSPIMSRLEILQPITVRMPCKLMVSRANLGLWVRQCYNRVTSRVSSPWQLRKLFLLQLTAVR